VWSCDLWLIIVLFILDITSHKLLDGTPKPEMTDG
jgi:hypothetical protein